jgi:plasmid stability protein
MNCTYSWIPAAIAVALLFSAGCSPMTEDDRAVQEGRKIEAEQREALRRALDGGTEEGVAIKLVKSAPAAQGEGTMEQWLQRQAATNGSSIFFPRWEADRRGMGKYEVIFTCTLMQNDGRVGKWGIVWFVDILPKLVASPREMTQSELSARSSRYLRDRRRGVPPEQLNVD